VAEAHSVVPWLEMGVAGLLIFTRTRWLGVGLACVMHLGILILVGPLMGDSNEVIWPWNLAMMLLVVLLFSSRERGQWKVSIRQARWGSRFSLVAIGSLVLIMPYFSSTGKWDRYLSFHLYTGTEHRYSLILLPRGLKKLPAEYHPYLKGEPPKLKELDAGTWSMVELKVPLVSEDRTMLQWCKTMMEVGEFQARDSFIHHDMLRNDKLSPQQLWPDMVKRMEVMPPLEPTPTR